MRVQWAYQTVVHLELLLFVCTSARSRRATFWRVKDAAGCQGVQYQRNYSGGLSAKVNTGELAFFLKNALNSPNTVIGMRLAFDFIRSVNILSER